MEDHQGQGQGQDGPSGHGSSEKKGSGGEPVRSRWTPKPEQILILESIFNSGMVNPPKDETVRIRKLLEKFGSVGDANVFYWFQNRRSRSRRRQRQMQAAANNQTAHATASLHNNNNNNNMYVNHHVDAAANTNTVSSFNALAPTVPSPTSFGAPSSTYVGSSSYGVMSTDDNLFSLSAQLGFPEMDQTSILDASTLHYQSGGYVTVVINGVATEVPRGPLDLKAMFGEDVMLVHSSGLPLPINEFGFLLQSLQHGESYFLVSRQT